LDIKVKNKLLQLFTDHFGVSADGFELLPHSGSYREYARISVGEKTVVGAYNADVKENIAFLTFSHQLRAAGVPVPEIYAVNSDQTLYLQQDLGSTTLFDFINHVRKSQGFSRTIIDEYRKVLEILPRIQVEGSKHIDYSVSYPRAAFDQQSMLWDLSYFKYYFLKLARIPFDEQLLEDDFQRFSTYLLSADSNYFLYRDFQSRNIMLQEGSVYFIDYQGGRQGALQYDLASLLYDGKADIPREVRTELFNYYLEQLENYISVDRYEFTRYYRGFVIIRIMQAMGAYGFRGFYEKKEHFLKSIPYALENLSYLLSRLDIPVEIPELTRVLNAVAASPYLRSLGQEPHNLTVRITSFSFKRGVPKDPSGNGGGFVFDCRAINNPGRYLEYKPLTGKDLPVQQFLVEKSEMNSFLHAVKALVDQSVKNYIDRGFSHLSVSFGCTGGQHRSVYATEQLAAYLRASYPVSVLVHHRELEK